MLRVSIYYFIIILLLSCDDRETIIEEKNKILRNELSKSLKSELWNLEDDVRELDYYLQVSGVTDSDAIDPYEDSALYFDYENLKTRFHRLIYEISSKNLSADQVKKDISRSPVNNYLVTKSVKDLLIFDTPFDIDSLNQLYLKTIIRRIQKEAYTSLFNRSGYHGNYTYPDPEVSIFNINDTSYISYSIIDTSSNKEVIIDSILINGINSKVHYSISFNNPLFAKLKIDSKGKIKFFGKYKVWAPKQEWVHYENFQGEIEK
jgi:hypothetical protein